MSSAPIEETLAEYKRLHRAVLTSTAPRWRDLDMSMQQLRAIYLLRDEEEASVGRLAELFGMRLPAASLLADRLVRAGLVDRREDPEDRRRVLLSLSRAGQRLVTELREGNYQPMRRWMAAMSPDDLAALKRGLRALADTASAAVREREATTV
jgi:DNA-binding MarR family transcriptional regulator